MCRRSSECNEFRGDQPRWKSVGVAQLLLKFVEKLVLKSGVKLGVKNQSARLSDILYASSV